MTPGDRVDSGRVDDALLKVDDDKSCFIVDCCDWHSVSLLGCDLVDWNHRSRKRSIFGKSAKKLESRDSFCCSPAESFCKIAVVSQSCLAARLSRSNFSHLLLSDIRVWRPSFGSEELPTKPASCKEVTMELID